MMDPIQAAIDELERRARVFMLKSQQCTEAAATMRTALATFNAVDDYVTATGTLHPEKLKQVVAASPQAKLQELGAPKRKEADAIIRKAIEQELSDGQAHPATAFFRALAVATKAGDSRVKTVVRACVAAKTVQQLGYGRRTCYQRAEGDYRYTMTAVDAAGRETPITPTPIAAPAPVAGVRPDGGSNGAIAAHLLREVFSTDAPVHAADVPTALEPKFGPIGYDQVKTVLDALVEEQALTTFRKGGELHYQRVPPKVPAPITMFDERLIKDALSSGASHSVADAHRSIARDHPHVTIEQVGRTLDKLAREKKVDVLSVGTTRRYRWKAQATA